MNFKKWVKSIQTAGYNGARAVNGLDCQCCLAGSSKTAPRIFIFSIVLGAEYLSYVKSIETHARTFLTLNILSIGTVGRNWNSNLILKNSCATNVLIICQKWHSG
jgi:hypothetical protein